MGVIQSDLSYLDVKLFSGSGKKWPLYTGHLKNLDSERPKPGPQAVFPIISREVYTPLHLEQ